MRRNRHRRQHLSSANVRAAKHPDSAIRLVQLSRPFHCVVTVRTFIAERIKVSAGIESSTRVLHDDDITMCGQFVGLLSPARSVVRRALEQDWKFFVTLSIT